jgi:carbonic anhydrase
VILQRSPWPPVHLKYLGRKLFNKIFFYRRELLSVTMASRDHTGLTRQLLDFQHDTMDEVGAEHDPFVDLKARFLDFKHRNCV